MVIWIIGLPGSGKTTLAKSLQKVLNKNNISTVHIDGDDMRSIWGDDIGYEIKDRKKNSLRIQTISSIFEKQNLVVIVSIMSIFEEHRKENRKLFSRYYEVFLDVSMDILKQRRTIYQDALDKKINNVVGVDLKYEEPRTFDIKFDKKLEINYLTNKILNKLELI
jgi:adenylylsulfate kinase